MSRIYHSLDNLPVCLGSNETRGVLLLSLATDSEHGVLPLNIIIEPQRVHNSVHG